MLHLRLVLRDVVERFLRRVGFAAFLGPAPGVVVISLACQTHLGHLCTEVPVATLGLTVQGVGEPSTAGRPRSGLASR